MPFKFIYFFFIGFIYLAQQVHSQATPNEIKLADQYFAEKKYNQAKDVYYKLIRDKKKIEKNALLKLAFIHEKENNFLKTLYFLNLYYEREPSQTVISKMNEITEEYNIDGYELSDFYLIVLILKQYSFIIYILFAFIGLYVTVIFILKKRKNQEIRVQQKFVLFLYLAGVILLFNIPRYYQQGIVFQENSTLRIDPSSASSVHEILQVGQRINIIGNEDIWLRVFKNNRFYYINKANVWLVN